MSRKTEMLRLEKIAVESRGYVASPCPKCSWWRLEFGNNLAFERDYSKEIRCNCLIRDK